MFRFVVRVVDTFSRRERRGLIIKSLRPLRSLRDLLNLERLPHCKKVSTANLNMSKYYSIIIAHFNLCRKISLCLYAKSTIQQNGFSCFKSNIASGGYLAC